MGLKIPGGAPGCRDYTHLSLKAATPLIKLNFNPESNLNVQYKKKITTHRVLMNGIISYTKQFFIPATPVDFFCVGLFNMGVYVD